MFTWQFGTAREPRAVSRSVTLVVIKEAHMARTIGIGIQDFGKIRENNCFYIDKTFFIKEWWERNDSTTLITRPRRFGKTMNLSMLETFFSVEYADRGDLFEGLSIWEEEKYRSLQGTYPVISLSFAGIKETDRTFFDQVLETEMKGSVATLALHYLSDYLYRYYGKKS